MIKLGKAFKHLRAMRQVTQVRMAEDIGVTPVYLCYLENDVCQPSLGLISLIEKRLKVNVYILAWCIRRHPPAVRKACNQLLEHLKGKVNL